MKILFIHARYQNPGGEESVLAAERRMLADAGHQVPLLEASNDSIVGLGRTIAAGLGAVYSPSGKRRAARAIAEHRPDVVHVHNFFPLLSPSVFDACGDAGVPVVQTLHNYRMICPGGLLFRDGRRCEECVGRAVPWPAVWHGCYRGSRSASAAAASMLAVNRRRGAFRHTVDAYIAISRFQREMILRSDIPAEKVFLKPTGLPDPGCSADPGPGEYALYLGRLSPEKGLVPLIDAYDGDGPAVPLHVVGDGPLRAELEERAARRGASDRIRFLGRRERAEVTELIRRARFLVFPTEYYEGLPLAPIEAAACGRPAVASRIGAVPEVVEDGASGWLVPPGDPRALRRAIEEAWSSPGEALRRGRAARSIYEQRFAEAASVAGLLAIYREVIHRRPADAGRGVTGYQEATR